MRRSVSRIRPSSSRSAFSRSSRWRLELLDVLERLLVLVLRERVDRADLLAAALQPLDAGLELRALGLGERLGGRLGLEAEPLGEAAELRRASRGASRACWARTSPRVTSSPRCLQPRVDLRLAGGAGAQLAGQPLAGRAVGLQLGAERLGLRGDRAAGVLERGREPLRGGRSAASRASAGLVERDPAGALGRARAPRARRAGARWRSRPAAARGARRRGPRRASCGAGRSASGRGARPRRPRRGRGRRRGRRARPRRGRVSASATARVAASTARARHARPARPSRPRRRARRAGCARRAPGPRRRRGPGAARACAADQTRTGARDRDAGEAGGSVVERLDDPDVREQRGRRAGARRGVGVEPGRGSSRRPHGGHRGRGSAGAGRRRPVVSSAASGRLGGRDQRRASVLARAVEQRARPRRRRRPRRPAGAGRARRSSASS